MSSITYLQRTDKKNRFYVDICQMYMFAFLYYIQVPFYILLDFFMYRLSYIIFSLLILFFIKAILLFLLCLIHKQFIPKNFFKWKLFFEMYIIWNHIYIDPMRCQFRIHLLNKNKKRITKFLLELSDWLYILLCRDKTLNNWNTSC